LLGTLGDMITGDLWIAVIIVVAIVVLRRAIARLVLRLAGRMLRALNLELPPDVANALVPTVSAIAVCAGMFVAIFILDLPKYISGPLLASVKSVVVIALYSGVSALLKSLQTRAASVDSENADEGLDWIAHLARLLIAILAAAIICEIWGFNISSAFAGVGLLGAAFALSLQDFVRDMVAGWSVRSAKKIKVGDWVELVGGSGEILFIGARTTQIRKWDQSLMIVPNQMLWNDKVTNWSKLPRRQILWKIGVPLNTSGDQLTAICAQISEFLRAHDGFEEAEELGPIVVIDSIGATSVVISIEAYTKTPKYSDLQRLKDDLARAILEIVEANGTYLAVPVSEVRLDRPEEARNG
jgi:MscS family membrane protein